MSSKSYTKSQLNRLGTNLKITNLQLFEPQNFELQSSKPNELHQSSPTETVHRTWETVPKTEPISKPYYIRSIDWQKGAHFSSFEPPEPQQKVCYAPNPPQKDRTLKQGFVQRLPSLNSHLVLLSNKLKILWLSNQKSTYFFEFFFFFKLLISAFEASSMRLP